jgi:N-acetylglutamate synthase
MSLSFHEFSIDQYPEAYALWESSEGIGLSEADSRGNIERFLGRNPGLSFTARDGGRLVGALLCGDDGRRGYLHHLAVAADHRRRGVGSALVDRSLAALAARGVRKCHIFVIRANEEGKRFWARVGWQERATLLIMSRDIAP